MSLGLLTVGMHEAGDFVESVEPYPHLHSGMGNICLTVARHERRCFFFCVAQYFATGLLQVAAYSYSQLPSVKPNTRFSTYNAGTCESSYRLGSEVLTALTSTIQVVYPVAHCRLVNGYRHLEGP